MITCVHCGQAHPDESKFCPSTGKPIGPGMATERVRPLGQQKGVFDLFKEAAELYRTHARAFLITTAVLFVPGSLINSCTAAALMAPAMVAAPAAERMTQRSEEAAKRIEEAARRGQTEQVVRETAQHAEETAREAAHYGAIAAGGASVFLLGMLGWALTALILYGALLPLTQGALTIAVADALLGGGADWRQNWTLLLKRLGLLITAILPAALLTFVGALFFLVPGLILSFLFTFVTPVVLLENIGGMAALKRSYELVRSDWLRVALVLIANLVGSAIAHRVGRIFVPGSALFLGNFLGDLLWLAIMPVPVITSVLLYFDLRRKLDGLDDDHMKAELETLRPVI